MNRRGFLFGVAGLVAAPSIVRAGSLMPVRSVVEGAAEAFLRLYNEDVHRTMQRATLSIVEWRSAIWYYPAHDNPRLLTR